MRYLASCSLTLACISATISTVYAKDITAEQSALLYDLLSPLSKENPPNHVDSKAYKNAVNILEQEKLVGQSARPHYAESGLLERYGKALFLGSRAPKFAKEIGEIRDLVDRGDSTALKQSLTDLWEKAGRKKPSSKELEPVLTSLYGTKSGEPQETVNHTFDRQDYKVEVTYAPAAGQMEVAVESKDANGEVNERTVIQGITETTPAEDGRELKRESKLDRVCTHMAEDSAEIPEYLFGSWHAASGREWEIAKEGENITLTDMRESGLPPLKYTGTYTLGEIYAEHPITEAHAFESGLPAEVKAQLIGMGQTYRVHLEACDNDKTKLTGTWSSQHVTYSSMSMTVSHIHDPYDLSLELSKEGEVKSGPGAAEGEWPS